MRCRKHDTDLSSITGVCASCLRERLFSIILAQEQAQAQSVEQNNCNSNLNTNPTVRRSVSPYINGQKSIATVQRPYNKLRLNHSLSDKRFYNSPQIAINTGGCIGGSSSNRRKPNLVRFPSISNLFRLNSRNGNGNVDADSNPRVSVSASSESCGTGGRSSSVTSTPSWFSNVLPGAGARQKNKASYVDERRCVRDRGMSPVRSSDDELSVVTSGYETAESCKLTPMKTPATVRRCVGQKSVAELIFCPLVRASPSRLMSMKGKLTVDGGFSGDVRSPAPAVPHLAYAKSFCANRSRKLADFGRSDSHR